MSSLNLIQSSWSYACFFIFNFHHLVLKEVEMSKHNHPINKEFSIHKDVIKRLTKPLAVSLYQKLIDKKTELSNRPLSFKKKLSLMVEERGGDQADQVNRLQEERRYTNRIQRDRLLLAQVLKALGKMEQGNYGICEYTEETIEIKRLKTLPWTTLSIEGAEIEENERHLTQRAR